MALSKSNIRMNKTTEFAKLNKARTYHCSRAWKPKLNSFRKPNLPLIDRKWYATDVFEMALSKSNIRANKSTEFANYLKNTGLLEYT